MSLKSAQEIRIDIEKSELKGAKEVVRHLSDLEGFFADTEAYQAVLNEGDHVVYHVQSVTPAQGAGDLHYGLGTLMPGKIGKEYFLTKGHFHSWREAAEIYIGLEGSGRMLLEEETGDSKVFPLQKHSIVYVPGHVAHRTVNTGNIPLKYLGIYPAAAGHDYGTIAERNFLKVIAEIEGVPQMLNREFFLEHYI